MLLKEAAIGTMRLKNRVVMSPMDFKFVDGNFSNSTITQRTVDVYRARAKGGVGLIITSHVKAEQKLDPYPKSLLFPIMDREERIKEFAALADAVHLYGAKIAAELSPGSGRYADYIEPGEEAVSASEMPTQYDSEVLTRPLTVPEIDYLVQCYGDAARRLKAAGFDAICVHCSCGYLLGQFLSPAWNRREDEYGGSTENRMRFLRRCIERVKEVNGADFPIILSLTVDEKLRNVQAGTLTTGKSLEGESLSFGSDGMTVEYAAEVARILERDGLVDAYHVRIGNYYNQEHIIPSAYSTNDEYREAITQFRGLVGKPVIFDNKLGDPEEMGRLIADGITDFTSLGRALIAEPDWVCKAERSPEDIRPCIRCMKCLETTWLGKYSACSVNPQFGFEGRPLVPALHKKRVLVVGGGPAGIQAALTAAARGHSVILAEQSGSLSGRVPEAGAADYKPELRRYAAWLERTLRASAVDVRLNTRADAAFVREIGPDVLFLAGGAGTRTMDIPGAERMISFEAVLDGTAELGDRVLIIGSGLSACETAYKLCQAGKDVTILSRGADILRQTSVVYRHAAVAKIKSTGVTILTGVEAAAVTENGVLLTNGTALEGDSVLLAIGLAAEHSLWNEVYGDVPEVYAIGDYREPRKIFDAVNEAYHIAEEL